MKKFVAATLFLLLSAGNSYADKWTKEDTAYEAAVGALLFIDYLQVRKTEAITNDDGKKLVPSKFFDSQVSSPQWFYPTAFVLHAMTMSLIPRPYRTYAQFVTLGVQSGMIFGNYKFTF